ncbi:MAG: hypothetical protein D3904_05410 [Candidatus Electrothrix sp. EH2]|nr:hypothetical protein [Candidatus Electrothrix sp. EH2]
MDTCSDLLQSGRPEATLRFPKPSPQGNHLASQGDCPAPLGDRLASQGDCSSPLGDGFAPLGDEGCDARDSWRNAVSVDKKADNNL